MTAEAEKRVVVVEDVDLLRDMVVGELGSLLEGVEVEGLGLDQALERFDEVAGSGGIIYLVRFPVTEYLDRFDELLGKLPVDQMAVYSFVDFVEGHLENKEVERLVLEGPGDLKKLAKIVKRRNSGDK